MSALSIQNLRFQKVNENLCGKKYICVVSKEDKV